MAENKIRLSDGDVETYIESVENERRREECRAATAMIAEVSGYPPRMWGDSMIGFGSYRYQSDSGRQGEWFLVGLAPRKQNLVLYIMPGFSQYDDLLARLGKHKTGKSCLYLTKYADVDQDVLRQLVRLSVDHMRAKYGV